MSLGYGGRSARVHNVRGGTTAAESKAGGGANGAVTGKARWLLNPDEGYVGSLAAAGGGLAHADGDASLVGVGGHAQEAPESSRSLLGIAADSAPNSGPSLVTDVDARSPLWGRIRKGDAVFAVDGKDACNWDATTVS